MPRLRLSWVLVTATATLAATALASAVPTAAAGPPTLASGPYTTTSLSETPTGSADGNEFFHVTATLAYSGDITGTENDSFNWVIHKDGSFEGKGTAVCDPCTIGSRTGTLNAIFTIKGSLGSGDLSGQVAFTGGSGGLEGIQGGGTYQGNVYSNINSYSYRYVFTR